MEQFTEANFASILGKIFVTRKEVEQFLKSLKEKDKIFASITRTNAGKPRPNEELISDIVKYRPNSTSNPQELFSWMVEVKKLFHESVKCNVATEMKNLFQNKVLRAEQMYSAAMQLDIAVIRLLTVDEIMDKIMRSKLDAESGGSKHACELEAGAGANFLFVQENSLCGFDVASYQ